MKNLIDAIRWVGLFFFIATAAGLFYYFQEKQLRKRLIGHIKSRDANVVIKSAES